jgi:hypothetical protein
MGDTFTFSNARMFKWLALALAVAVLLVAIRPPAFWLCGVGVPLMLIGKIANSGRTDQWMSWQNEGSLNWFEGCAVSTGVILVVVPLVGAILRSLLS